MDSTSVIPSHQQQQRSSSDPTSLNLYYCRNFSRPTSTKKPFRRFSAEFQSILRGRSSFEVLNDIREKQEDNNNNSTAVHSPTVTEKFEGILEKLTFLQDELTGFCDGGEDSKVAKSEDTDNKDRAEQDQDSELVESEYIGNEFEKVTEKQLAEVEHSEESENTKLEKRLEQVTFNGEKLMTSKDSEFKNDREESNQEDFVDDLKVTFDERERSSRQESFESNTSLESVDSQNEVVRKDSRSKDEFNSSRKEKNRKMCVYEEPKFSNLEQPEDRKRRPLSLHVESSTPMNRLQMKRKSLSVNNMSSYSFDDEDLTSFYRRERQESFFGKIMSVDGNNEDEGYGSSRCRRRNGQNFLDDQQDDFLSDLVEFKRRLKKTSGGMKLAKSVENIFRLDRSSHTPVGRLRSISEIKPPSLIDHSQKPSFFQKMIGSRTSSSDGFQPSQNISRGKSRRLSINIVEDSVKKLTGINEMHLDAQGNVVRTVEIKKRRMGQSLGFSLRVGNGIDSHEGIFVSRVALASFADVNNLLHTGDQILRINKQNVSLLPLENAVSIIQKSENLLIEIKSALPLPMHARPPTSVKTVIPAKSKLTGTQSLFDNRKLDHSLTTSDLTKYFKAKSVELPTERHASEPHLRSRTTMDSSNDQKSYKRTKSLEHKNLIQNTFSNTTKFIKTPKLFKRNNKKEESFEIAEKDLRIYPSDVEDTVARKNFTGNLLLTVNRIEFTESSNQSRQEVYAAVFIDNESKAITQHFMTSSNVDECFDLEVTKASYLVLRIMTSSTQQQVAFARICLGKLLAYDNEAVLGLVSECGVYRVRTKVTFQGVDSFLKRTPSTREKGVFGHNISQTMIDNGNTIPFIVRKCVEEIESRGLMLEGLYRISGNARKKRELKAVFETGSVTEVDDVTEEFDCHVITGVLKDYLRELPQPLISREIFEMLHSRIDEEVAGQAHDALLHALMKGVHYSNRATLIYIMEHLLKVAAEKASTKMDFKNLSVCFGPVLMSSPVTLSGMDDVMRQVDTLKFLLQIWPKLSQENAL